MMISVVGGLTTACALTGGAATAPAVSIRPIKPVATVTAALLAGGSMVAASGSIWTDSSKGIQRIDPATNAVVATIPMPNSYGIGLAAGADAVWAADFDQSVVRRIDPATNQVVATIPVGANPAAVTVFDGNVWVANHRSGSVSRIDPSTNTVVATVKAGLVGKGGPQPIAVGFGDIWTGVSNTNSVVRIDPLTNDAKANVKLRSTALACGQIAVVRSALWISSCGVRATISQIDPKANKAVSTVDVGGWANGAVVNRGKAWYSVSGVDTGITPRLVRIEPGMRKPTAIRFLAPQVKDPGAMLVAFGSLWLGYGLAGKIFRFPLNVLK